jgi:hypothetical protein
MGRFPCVGHPRIPRCVRIVVRAYDDACAATRRAHHHRDRGEVAGTERHGDSEAGGRVDAGGGCIALGEADRVRRAVDDETEPGSSAALEKPFRPARADELQVVQLTARIAHRHDQSALTNTQAVRTDALLCEIGMTVFSEPGSLPDARGTRASGGVALFGLRATPSAGSLRPSTQFIELLRRRRAPGIEAPAARDRLTEERTADPADLRTLDHCIRTSAPRRNRTPARRFVSLRRARFGTAGRRVPQKEAARRS